MKTTVSEIEELVEQALEHFGLQGATLRFVKHRENTVFRADSDKGAFAVRVSQNRARSAAQLDTESAYLLALRRSGFAVPEPVALAGGDGWTHPVVSASGEGFRIAVQRWEESTLPLGDIESAFDGTSQLTPADFVRLGAIAGRLHNVLGDLGRLPDFDRAAWDAAGLFGPDAQWGNPLDLPQLTGDQRRVLEESTRLLTAELEQLGQGPEVYGVIHADLSPENFLVRGSETIVIDFDDFGEGWHLYELSTLLFFFQPHPSYPDFLRATIEGYRTERTLSEGDLELWTGMLLARGLTFLGWASRHPENETTPFLLDEILPLVVSLAGEYVHEASRASPSE